MSFGVITGFYIPFNLWARDEDCFSNFLFLGDTIVSYHTAFDGEELPKKTVGKVLYATRVSADIITTGIETYSVCKKQYDNEKTENWYSWFQRMPISQLGSIKSGPQVKDLIRVMKIVFSGLNWWKLVGNNFY